MKKLITILLLLLLFYNSQAQEIKIYKVTWCITQEVSDSCDFGSSEFGEQSNISCAVYHVKTINKCDNVKEFKNIEDAIKFYQKGLAKSKAKVDSYGILNNNNKISKVKLDSIIKVQDNEKVNNTHISTHNNK